jgi:hypothetical protein
MHSSSSSIIAAERLAGRQSEEITEVLRGFVFQIDGLAGQIRMLFIIDEDAN